MDYTTVPVGFEGFTRLNFVEMSTFTKIIIIIFFIMFRLFLPKEFLRYCLAFE